MKHKEERAARKKETEVAEEKAAMAKKPKAKETKRDESV